MDKKAIQFYLGGHPLQFPSYETYKASGECGTTSSFNGRRRAIRPRDGSKTDRPTFAPGATPRAAPSLYVRHRSYRLIDAPRGLGGLFRPFSLVKAPGVHFYENTQLAGVFSCKIGDVVGTIREDGNLETTFRVDGIAIDVAPVHVEGTDMTIVSPVANDKRQLFWQAYGKTDDRITGQSRPSRMVWVVRDPKKGYVAINQRKFVFSPTSKDPLNEYEALIKPLFDGVFWTGKEWKIQKFGSPKNAQERRAVGVRIEREWSKFLVEMYKKDPQRAKVMRNNSSLMGGIHAALYEMAGMKFQR